MNDTPSRENSQLYETPGPIVPLTTFNCGGTSPEQIVNAVGVIVPPTTCGKTVIVIVLLYSKQLVKLEISLVAFLLNNVVWKSFPGSTKV